MEATRTSRYREISKDRVDEFFYKGYKRRHFFPHKIYHLPKCGPDGYKIARWMCGDCELNQLWEIIIYADPRLTDEFPQELFFDDDLIWHQQQFGKTGQVATANLAISGGSLHSMVHLSDLVQRISRRREYKTRIENRFKGWNHMLLNSILNFALENNLNPVYSPTADLALQNTDPARTVGRELFERIYDRDIHHLFKATRKGGWWVIDLNENRDRVVVPEGKQEALQTGKTICLCHDIERGFGHTDVDRRLAKLADRTSGIHLEKMLTVEDGLNVKATYNVLGLILPEVREQIKKSGHSIAFHSYDHQTGDHREDEGETDSKSFLEFFKLRQKRQKARARPEGVSQLDKCREIDYRIKGYRPPQSKITPELSDDKLAFHNFEWFACSSYALQIDAPEIQNRIVKIPILFDDFDLYDRKMKYEDWEKTAIETITQNDFVAFGLHDCYAHFWLPHYRRFLEVILGLGTFKTLDEIAGEVTFSNAK